MFALLTRAVTFLRQIMKEHTVFLIAHPVNFFPLKVMMTVIHRPVYNSRLHNPWVGKRPESATLHLHLDIIKSCFGGTKRHGQVQPIKLGWMIGKVHQRHDLPFSDVYIGRACVIYLAPPFLWEKKCVSRDKYQFFFNTLLTLRFPSSAPCLFHFRD